MTVAIKVIDTALRGRKFTLVPDAFVHLIFSRILLLLEYSNYHQLSLEDCNFKRDIKQEVALIIDENSIVELNMWTLSLIMVYNVNYITFPCRAQ